MIMMTLCESYSWLRWDTVSISVVFIYLDVTGLWLPSGPDVSGNIDDWFKMGTRLGARQKLNAICVIAYTKCKKNWS